MKERKREKETFKDTKIKGNKLEKSRIAHDFNAFYECNIFY